MSDPCTRATKAIAKGDLKAALNHANRCTKALKKKLRKVKNQPELEVRLRVQLSQIQILVAQINIDQRKFSAAQRSLEASKTYSSALTQSIVKSAVQGQIDYYMGIILLYKNNVDASIEYLISAQTNYVEAKRFDDAINVTFKLGTVFRELASYDEAIKQFQLSVKFTKSVKDRKKRRVITALALLEEGRTQRLAKMNSAEKVLKKAKKAFSKLKDAKGEAETILELVNLFEDNNPEYSRELLLEAKDLGEVANSQLILGSVFSKLGVLDLKAGNFDVGKQQLLKGLKYRTEGGDKIGTAKTLVELSRIGLLTSRNEDDLQNALNFASQAFDLYNQESHEYGQATALELMGTLNARLSNLEDASDQIYTGKKIFEKYKDQEAEARMLTQLGLILDLQGKKEEAVLVLDKAIKLYKKHNNRQGLAEAHHVLGMQNVETDPETAAFHLKKSYQLYENIFGTQKDIQPILTSISRTLENLDTDSN